MGSTLPRGAVQSRSNSVAQESPLPATKGELEPRINADRRRFQAFSIRVNPSSSAVLLRAFLIRGFGDP